MVFSVTSRLMRGCAIAAFALASTVNAEPVFAQSTAAQTIVIEVQPLDEALVEVGRRYGVSVVASDTLTRGRTAPRIVGRLTAQQALEQLLRGSGLHLTRSASGSYIVAGQGDAKASPTSSIDGSDIEGDASDIVVTGIQFNDNVVESAYKLPLEAKDIPQSVKVFTPDVLRAARVDRFEKIYKLDASAHPSHLVDGFSRNYYRGFLADSDNAYRIDGLRAFGVLDLSFASFERLEMIKGSTSTLYGRAVIGGTTNAVSKKPTATFQASAYAEAGNYDYYQGGIDISGPVSGDGRLRARLVGNYLNTGSHIDYFEKETIVVAPSLQYAFSDDTALTLQVNYQKDDFLPLGNFGTQILNDDASDPDNYQIPDVPRSRLGNFRDAYTESELFYARALLETKISDWTLRANGFYAALRNETTSGQAVVTHADGSTDFEIFSNDTRSRIYAAEATLFGDVHAFGRKHTLFFGADYYRSSGKGFSGYAGFIPFSIYQPDYDALGSAERFRDLRNYSINPNDPRNNPLLAGAYSEITGGRSLSEEYGFTGQVILRPTDKWTVIGGTRWSHSSGGRSSIYCYAEEDCTLTVLDTPLPKVDSASQSAWTFQVGTTYAVTPQINLYASFGETYTPRFNAFQFDPADPVGRPIGPEQGEAYEVGAKGVHGGGKLSWSVALFDIARTNITQSDPSRPQFLILLGKQRSRGIEFDLQGTITEGWELFSSFSVMDNKFVAGEFAGYKAFFAPKLGASVYSNYEFLRGDLAGLGLGGGIVYKKLPTYQAFDGDALGQPLQGLNPGSIVEVDASISYKLDKWKFSLQATNLLNTEYHTPSYPYPWYAINVNPGRQVIARIDYKF